MTAATDLCIHELDPRWCADCQRTRTPALETRTAVASFQSRCDWCDEPILAGQKLALVDDEWVHHHHTEQGGRW